VQRPILGKSQAIQDLLNVIERVATSKVNILVIGESGTGKELVARRIHDLGPFREKPFVPVNCGAIPENLMETELFGHHRGSFTGAVQDKTGLFEMAHHGTLFLDEVGELSLAMQVKLLRAIQERSFRKVGGVQDIKVDVRIIAATNRDLEAAVARGTFREDLYYRLNVILIKTPPLRERPGDIGLLAQEFLKQLTAQLTTKTGKKINGFEPAAMQELEAYHWPGNVRELENSIERAVTLESGSLITPASLPEWVRNAKGSEQGGRASGKGSSLAQQENGIFLPAPDFAQGNIPLEQILEKVERTYLLAAMKEARGSKKKAAELLGMTLRSVRYRLTKLGISF